MKKKVKAPTTATVLLPTDLKVEFRKVCIMHDLKPSAVLQRIVATWIDKEKKRHHAPQIIQASNG